MFVTWSRVKVDSALKIQLYYVFDELQLRYAVLIVTDRTKRTRVILLGLLYCTAPYFDNKRFTKAIYYLLYYCVEHTYGLKIEQ